MCEPKAGARQNAIARLFDATVAFLQCDESMLPNLKNQRLFELLLARRACGELGISTNVVNDTLRLAQAHAKAT